MTIQSVENEAKGHNFSKNVFYCKHSGIEPLSSVSDVDIITGDISERISVGQAFRCLCVQPAHWNHSCNDVTGTSGHAHLLYAPEIQSHFMGLTSANISPQQPYC